MALSTIHIRGKYIPVYLMVRTAEQKKMDWQQRKNKNVNIITKQPPQVCGVAMLRLFGFPIPWRLRLLLTAVLLLHWLRDARNRITSHCRKRFHHNLFMPTVDACRTILVVIIYIGVVNSFTWQWSGATNRKLSSMFQPFTVGGSPAPNVVAMQDDLHHEMTLRVWLAAFASPLRAAFPANWRTYYNYCSSELRCCLTTCSGTAAAVGITLFWTSLSGARRHASTSFAVVPLSSMPHCSGKGCMYSTRQAEAEISCSRATCTSMQQLLIASCCCCCIKAVREFAL